MILLQIESQPTITSLLIIAITAESGVIVFLFFYVKALHKEIADVYKEQLMNNRDMITKNTEAFVKHTEAVEESADAARELKEAFTNLKLWLNDRFK